jgi:hypothetical protein
MIERSGLEVTVAPFPTLEKPQDSPDAAPYLAKNAKYISRLVGMVCNLVLFGDADGKRDQSSG